MQQDSDTTGELDATPSTLVDWTESEYLVMNDFVDLAERRIHMKQLEEQIKHEIEALNLEIGAMMATADVKSVRFGHHRLTLGQSVSGGRLSKEKLLEAGVTAEQIARATGPKRYGARFVSVTEIKGPED